MPLINHVGIAPIAQTEEKKQWDSAQDQPRSSKSPNPSLSWFPSRLLQSQSGLTIPWPRNWFRHSNGSFDKEMSDKASFRIAFGGSYGASCPFCGSVIGPKQIHSCGGGVDLPLIATCDYCGQVYDANVVHCCPLPHETRELPIVGFRAWKVNERYRIGVGRSGAVLQSVGIDYVWKTEPEPATCSGQATCRHHDGEIPPHPYCGCGFYVMMDLDLAGHVYLQDHIVIGAILGWGRVIQHGNEGWRSQFARPLALLDLKYSEENDRLARLAAQVYNLPILERRALELMVREYGDPLEKKEVAS